MGKERKPRAYIEHLFDGFFVFSPEYIWRGIDNRGNLVSYGHTRKECERDARSRGYVPVRN